MDQDANLLIVEDEPVTRGILASHPDWQEEGFKKVKTVENGRQALKLLETFCPQVIITDVKMPGLGGIEMIRHMADRGNQAQIIVVTAYADMDVMRAAIRLHVFDVIQKPVDFAELLYAVRRSLGKKAVPPPSAWNFSDPLEADGSARSSVRQEPVVTKRIKEYILDHFADPGLGVAETAAHFHYTSSYICALFKKHAGTSINDFITATRMEQARLLLRDGSLKVHHARSVVERYRLYNDLTRAINSIEAANGNRLGIYLPEHFLFLNDLHHFYYAEFGGLAFSEELREWQWVDQYNPEARRIYSLHHSRQIQVEMSASTRRILVGPGFPRKKSTGIWRCWRPSLAAPYPC